MDTVFVLLLLLSLVGIVWPKPLVKYGMTRWKFAGLAVVFFFLFGLVAKPSRTPAQAKVLEAQQAATSSAESKNAANEARADAEQKAKYDKAAGRQKVADDKAAAKQKENDASDEFNRNARAIAAVRIKQVLKDAARDPDSVIFEKVRINEDASVICVNYRARNGFGGMNREFVVIAHGKVSQSASVWNKRCVNTLMEDYA